MQPSHQALKKIVLDALRRAPREDTPIFAWPLVSGPAVASKTHAIEFQSGTLKVTVPDKTWQAQMRDMAPEFLAALNKLSSVSVNRIEFVLAEATKFRP